MKAEEIRPEDMNEKQIFDIVFAKLQKKHRRISMQGTLVCYDGRVVFNTDGYDLGYNLYRLTKMLNEQGEFE